MNAEEARRITAEACSTGETVTAWMGAIYRKIEAAAKEGRREINHPFAGVRMAYPTPHQAEGIWHRLRDLGFTVTHHDNPDAGDPRSTSYTSISW